MATLFEVVIIKINKEILILQQHYMYCISVGFKKRWKTVSHDTSRYVTNIFLKIHTLVKLLNKFT